jgi:hypothetical protein
LGQARVISGYVNSTKVATVGHAWTTNPDATSVYYILNNDAPKIDANLKVAGVVLTDTITTHTGNTPQTGDNFARIGAPAGASVSADIAATKADTAAIKLKTDNLPGSPAAVGSAMTLTSGERTSIANEVENQIIDETDSEKVLTAITDKIASVNPSLAGLTTAAIATAVRDKAIAGSAAGSLGEALAGVKLKTDNLPANPAATSDIPTANITAIKAKTDSLAFTKAGEIDANIQSVNDVAVAGTGAIGNEWGPA